MIETKQINIEQQIVDAVRDGIGKIIADKIGGYGETPLNKMIERAVLSRHEQFTALIEGSIDAALSGESRKYLSDAISHKIARALVTKMEGQIEKSVNDIRNNPTMRARITLAVEREIVAMTKG